MVITPTAAIIGSAVVGGVAQSMSAKSAASAQRHAAATASAQEQGFFDTAQGNLQPFIDTGTGAASKIGQLQGLDGSDSSGIQATLEGLPGYQFANRQGLKSVQNSATQRGLAVSGAAQKGAADYSTGLANQYYNNLLTGLQQTESTGANAANGLASAAVDTGKEIGGNTLGAGKATANSDLATGSAVAGIANSVPSGLLTKQLLQNQTGADQTQNDYLAASSPTYGPYPLNQNALANGLAWSDITLKENITPMGIENGFPVYEFNYTWHPKRYIGVIAQEIMNAVPDAIKKVGSYLMVDYAKLGVEFREV